MFAIIYTGPEKNPWDIEEKERRNKELPKYYSDDMFEIIKKKGEKQNGKENSV